MPPLNIHTIHLRHATPTDIPQMVSLLIKAFSPTGPWFDLLFPAHLRTTTTCTTMTTTTTDMIDKYCGFTEHADQIAWRTRVLTHQLTDNPGHRHILAIQTGKETKEDEQEEVTVAVVDSIVGWAHWYLASHDPLTSSHPIPEQRQKYTERTIWGSSHPPGLDKSALQDMGRQGEGVEKVIDTFLLPRGRTRHDAVELHYLMVDPAHQRKGIGHMLLREGLDRVAMGKWHDAPSGSAMTPRDVYLRSTVEGRALYLAHGFQQLGEGMVFGVRQFPMVKSLAAPNQMPRSL